MPRSYSFDHFQSKNPAHAKVQDKRVLESQEFSDDASTEEISPQGGGKIHYGEKFHQTKELFQARAMNAELEKLAREDSALSDELPEPKPRQKSSPIGAIPEAAEMFKEGRMGEVVESARHYFQMIGGAAKDVTMAGLQIMLLPLAAVRVVAKRFAHDK